MSHMKIVIGTRNPKKIAVVEKIFREVLKPDSLETIGKDIESGVPEAPHDAETYQGALNRAKGCRELENAEYSVGIESGVVERYGHFFEEAWAVIISRDGSERIGYSSGLLLPPVVVRRMKDGEMHNDIMESYDREFNLPNDNRDTWSRYTGGNISRQVSLEEALRNALIQTSYSEQNLYLR